jgi:sulfite exporter TauE/SafE
MTARYFLKMTNNFTLILSLTSLGFFGGFSHCVGMCGPFVLTQVSNRLQKTPLENFSNFQKLKNLALLPYHAGRITTYVFLGFLCSFFTKNIQDFSGFRFLSALFLFFASLFFLSLFTTSLSSPRRRGSRLFFLDSRLRGDDKCGGKFSDFALRFKSKNLKKLGLFQKKISFLKKILPLTPTLSQSKFSWGRGRGVVTNLFQDPRGFRGYFLGLILGFIPCGLLYGAFAISAAISSPILAAVGMFFFGISTFPSLFFTACGGFFLTKLPEFKFIAKTVILINAIMLFLMALRQLI